jgi:hypothetical protein
MTDKLRETLESQVWSEFEATQYRLSDALNSATQIAISGEVHPTSLEKIEGYFEQARNDAGGLGLDITEITESIGNLFLSRS